MIWTVVLTTKGDLAAATLLNIRPLNDLIQFGAGGHAAGTNLTPLVAQNLRPFKTRAEKHPKWRPFTMEAKQRDAQHFRCFFPVHYDSLFFFLILLKTTFYRRLLFPIDSEKSHIHRIRKHLECVPGLENELPQHHCLRENRKVKKKNC